VGACIACHGPNGTGNAPAAYPAIAGQHTAYTAAQLKAYRAGQRASDKNQIMRNNAARLTDAEIDAVASYIQGLR
jgi:cytochrome c553